MKNTLHRILVGIVLVTLLASFGGLGAAAEEANPAPADLLGETMNPFYGIAFPDGYTIFRAVYEQREHTYSLYLNAADTAEQTVAFIMGALGSVDAGIIGLAAETLQNSGVVGLEVMNTLTGVSTGCEISNYAQEGDYKMVLRRTVADSGALDMFLAANLSRDALGDVAGYFDFAAAEEAEFMLDISENIARARYTFQLPDAEAVKKEVTAAFADDYVATGDQLMMRYGDIATNVHFEAADDGVLYIEQQMNATDICLGSYVPPLTLRNVGFEFREDNANWDYHDRSNGVYISINKSEWGERQNQSENNAISFGKEFAEDTGYWVFYYPAEGRYIIILQTDTMAMEYTCVRTGDMLTCVIQNDLQNTEEIAGQLFPEADHVLYAALDGFDTYVADAFGMTVDALYAVKPE